MSNGAEELGRMNWEGGGGREREWGRGDNERGRERETGCGARERFHAAGPLRERLAPLMLGHRLLKLAILTTSPRDATFS